MSRLIKDLRDSSHSRSTPESCSALGLSLSNSVAKSVDSNPNGSVSTSNSIMFPKAVPTSGSNSPLTGKKIARTVKQLGDKTRTKSRGILKRWNTTGACRASSESLGIEDLKIASALAEKKEEKKSTWSVHVWATWVRRPYEDDDDTHKPEGKIHLSSFQIEKFRYYFNDVFDHNKDQVITIEDIKALNERMRHYAGWSDDNEYYLTMKEIHADFFECLLEHVGKIEPEYGFEFDIDRIPDRVQLYQWYNMWGDLTHGAKAMADFPVWLQILPKILFKVINRKDDGIISYEDLRSFYAHFIKLKDDLVDPMTSEAYAALTSCSDFPLTERVYLMAFANFLLGKTPHGPGKYIFGGFKESDVHPFQVDYSCLDDD